MKPLFLFIQIRPSIDTRQQNYTLMEYVNMCLLMFIKQLYAYT